MYITAVALLALGCSDEGPKGETIEPREEMTPTIPEVTTPSVSQRSGRARSSQRNVKT